MFSFFFRHLTCVGPCSCIFLITESSIVCTDHFTCSPVDRHAFGTILDTSCRVCVVILPQGSYQEWINESYVSVSLVLWKTTRLFPKVLVPFSLLQTIFKFQWVFSLFHFHRFAECEECLTAAQLPEDCQPWDFFLCCWVTWIPIFVNGLVPIIIIFFIYWSSFYCLALSPWSNIFIDNILSQ